MKPRKVLDFLSLILVVLTIASVTGCTTLFGNKQDEVPNLEELQEEEGTLLIGGLTGTVGKQFLKIEGVALATGLAGTGSDPPPGPLRDALITDMQKRNVDDPQKVLASNSSALVMVRAFLPPGVRKGDRVDIDVRIPRGAKTESLDGAWLMPCRLQEVQVLANAVHHGDVKATGAGAVLIEAAFRAAEDDVYLGRGRVLGGGLSNVNRPLGLIVRSEHASVQVSTKIAGAINARFDIFARGGKKGVAEPKRDNFIELEVHPRYRRNVGRYLKVIESIAVSEKESERADRMQELRVTIHDPQQAPDAALQLEAIGEEAASILLEAVQSNDPDVRFYAAEALAYLDKAEAAEPLAVAAVHEPSFRWHAMTALAAMDHVVAYDALTDLLHEVSAETRYGAFRALRHRNQNGPIVAGETVKDFYLHEISTHGPPMIHVSQKTRPEIVLFGVNQQVNLPNFIYAGSKILVKQIGPRQLRITRFEPGKPDRAEVCDATVRSLIHAITAVGGNYLDILDGMRNAKKVGAIEARVVLDARPDPRKILQRFESEDENDNEELEEISP